VWTAVPDFGFNNIDGLNSKLSQNGQVGVFSCWGGPLFRTLNGGTSWNQTLTGITANGIAMSSNGQKIFLAVRDFPIHVSTNSGTNWSPVSGLANFWADVDCSADGLIAIACRGNTGTVHVTTNGGLNSGDWTEQVIAGATNISFVACSSDGTKRFAASSNGFIYTWDSGSGWVQRDSSRQWAGLTSSADGTKLAATVSGDSVYTSTDSGASWTARATSESWTRIDSSDDGSVLITSVSAGTAKGLYTSYDSGVTWTPRASSLNPSNPLHWRGASVSGDGTRMFAPIGGGTAPQALYMSDTSPGPSQAPAGTDKTVTATSGTYSFTKTDFGFTDSDSPANNFTAVKITTVPGGSLTLGGNPVTAGQVIPVTTLPAGETWVSTTPPSDYPTSFALSENGSAILMTGWNGGIYRSTDGGATWTNRLSASFRGAVAITPDGTRAIAVHRPNGAVYTSTDSGETFVSQGTSRNYTSIAISSDGMKAIAGTDGDALFLTTDGGITWNAVTDPVAGTGTWTDVASSADGTKLIASKYNGTLYTSTDSGATWTARDVARAWFGVSSSGDGTKLAAAVNGGNIYTSTDSGATWTPRATSQNWATINSSGDGTVLIATLGIGNLYTSTDAGLTWTARDSSRNWVASGVSHNGGKMIAGVGGASGGLPAGGPQAFLSNGPPPVFPVWTGSSNTSFTFQVRDDGSTANGGVTEDPTPNTMTIQIPNVAPTDISLSSTAINENAGLNGVVGALTATDGDSGDTHTFTLVAGSGDTDNGSFNINGANLRLNASADYETKTSYSVRIQAVDGKGGLFQKEFTITVNNLNDIAPEITAVSRYLITGGANANANAMRLMRLNADGSAILSNTALPSLALTGGSGNAVYNPTSGYLVFGSNALNLNSYLAGGSFAVSGIAGLGNNAPWSAHLPSGRFVTPRRNGTGNAPVETFNPLTGTITSGGNHTAFIPEASWIYNGNLYNLNEGYSLLQIPVAADGSTTGSMTSAPSNFTTALGIPHGNGGFTETSRLAIDPADGMALFSNGFQNLYLFDFDGPYAPGGYTLINLHSHLITSGGGFTYNSALTNGFNVTYDSAAEVFYAAGSLSNGTDYRGFLVRITKAGAVTVLAQELAGDPVYTGFLAGLAYAPVSGNTFSLTENSANSTVVGTLSATDGDAGTTFSDWTITGGNTGGAFAINASSGQITVANRAAVDFETTPVFTLTVTVSDGVNTSAPFDVTINLTDVYEPVILTGGSLSITLPLGANNSLSLSVSGGDLVVSDGVVTENVPLSGITGPITITGGTGNETITIGNLGNLAGNLIIDGGAGTDSIVFANSLTANLITATAESITVNSGAVVETTGGDFTLVAANGVTINGTVDSRSHELAINADSDANGTGTLTAGPSAGVYGETISVLTADVAIDGGANVGRAEVTSFTGSVFADVTGNPYFINFDSSGDLYVNGSANVEKVTPAGVVTVAATGMGGVGVAVDSAGNIYGSSAGNQLLKSPPGGGGSPFAIVSGSLIEVHDMMFDAAGILHTADYSSGTISKVTPAGASSVLVGGITRPIGIDFDSLGNLIVADHFLGQIRKVTPSGTITTLVSTGLLNPVDVAVDANDDIFVSDYGNSRIARVTSGGGLTTVASGITARGLAFGPDGALYAGDVGAGVIRKFALTGSVTNQLTIRPSQTNRAIDLGTNTPGAIGLTELELDRIALAPGGSLLIGSSTSGPITISSVLSPAGFNTLELQKAATFSATGGFVSEIASATSYTQLKVNGALAINPAATLTVNAVGGYVPAPGDAYKLIDNVSTDPTTGNFNGKPTGTNVPVGGVNKSIDYALGAGFNDVILSPPGAPAAILDGGELTISLPSSGGSGTVTTSVSGGNLVISDGTTTTTIPVSSLTGPITINGNSGDETIDLGNLGTLPNPLVVEGGGGSDAVLFSSSLTAPTISVVAETVTINSGAVVKTTGGDLILTATDGVTINGTVDSGVNELAINADSDANGTGTLVAGAASGMYGDTISVLTADVNINPTANVGSAAGGPYTSSVYSASVGDPYFIEFDSAGNLFVLDYASVNRLKKVSPQGVVSTLYTGTGLGMTVDDAGNAYFIVGAVVKKITPAGAVSDYGTWFGGSYEMAFDSAGYLYLAGYSNPWVERIPPGGGAATIFASGLGSPIGLDFDSLGNLIVADYQGTVKKVTPAGAVSTIVSSGLTNTYSVAIDANDNIFVGDFQGGNVYRVTSEGGLVRIASGLPNVKGLAFGPDGNLYVAKADVPPTQIVKLIPGGTATNEFTIRPSQPNRSINLGTNAAGSIGLTEAELDRISVTPPGSLRIGNATSGPITISSVLSPTGFNTLDLQNAVTFSATGGFVSEVASATDYDKLKVNGALTINPSATLTVNAVGGFVPAAGDTFTLIENTSSSPTTGTFSGKPAGATVPVGGVNKTLEYAFGSGANDVILSTPGAPAIILTGGNLSISLPSGGGGGNLATSVSGGNLVISDGTNTTNIPLTSITGTIAITGSTGDDTIDLGNLGTLTNPLVVNGGAGTDSIAFNGEVTAPSITVIAETITVGVSGDLASTTGPLTLSATDGVTMNGTVDSGANALVINADTDGNGTGTLVLGAGSSVLGDTIDLIAADFSIDPTATIGTVTTTSVTLRQSENGRAIDLGTNTPGSVGLTLAELGTITMAPTGSLIIGDENSGTITISAVLDPTGYRLIDLRSDVTFSATGGFVSEIVSATEYDQILVNGSLMIDPAASLTATVVGLFVPAAGDAFILIDNLSTEPTSGSFTGKPSGTILPVGGVDKKIGYGLGAGFNNVALVEPPTAPVIGNSAVPLNLSGTNFGLIPDSDPNGRDILFNVAGAVGVVETVSVQVGFNPAHPRLDNLRIQLIAPDNTSAWIFGTAYSANHPMAGPYTFTDGAATSLYAATGSVSGGTTMPSGSYRAGENISNATVTLVSLNLTFAGSDPNGIWRLRVADYNDPSNSGGGVSQASLTVTTGGTGELRITLPDVGTNLLSTTVSGGNLIISDGVNVQTIPLAGITGPITIIGGTGDDTIDLGNLGTLPNPLVVDGGDGTDHFSFSGGITAPSISVISETITVGGGGQLTSTNGPIELAASNGVTIEGSVDSGTNPLVINGDSDANGSGNLVLGPGSSLLGATIDLKGADFVIDPTATIGNPTTNSVTLRPSINGRAIDLGTNTPGAVGLTNGELNRVTVSPTGSLIIGDANSGPITISAPLSPEGFRLLDLRRNVTFSATGGFISDITSGGNYERIIVAGTVTIEPGATLALNPVGGYVWNGTDSFTIIDNDGNDPFTGTFTGPSLSNFLGSMTAAKRSYSEGSGNDLRFLPFSNNANLSDLTLSSGSISPVFAPATTAYNAFVSDLVTSVTVTPTFEEPNATIEARIGSNAFASVASGSPSASLPLAIGVNTIDVRVTAEDGTTQKIYTITVTRNAGPTDISLTNASLPENNTPPTTVGTLAAVGDPNPGDTHTFTLVTGTGDNDNGSFLINGSTLRFNVAANFELKPAYSIRVQADDGGGGLFSRALIVSITNVNEPPTGLSLSNTVLPENSGANAIIGTVSALGDPDAGATHVFTLVTGSGSADNTLFNLTGNTLRKVTNADYEDRTSYSIRLRADDGLGGVAEEAFTITITNVNEAPTDISLSGTTVPENAGANTLIGSLAALGDPDAGASHTFALVGGTGSADNAAFTLSGTTLRLNASADFETKPSYSIRVQASDGIDGTFEEVFTISVTNVNEAPTDISLSNATVPENAGANAAVGNVAAVGDPDAGATHTYTLVAGAGDTDNASFNLSGASLRLNASANFEDKASYTVRVHADDGNTGTFEKAFTISVTNVNEAPTDLTINDATVDENAGANAVVGAFTTVGDPDAGAVHTYTLVSGVDDDDNTAFNINGANLRLTASANFELKSSYKVRVKTDDGLGGVFEKAFTISVNNVNEAPTDLTLGNSSVPENAGANAVVGTLTAAGDPDAGATHTYALVAGIGATDNADFNIDGTSLRLTASANFESKASYTVRVRADDGLGGIFEKAFAISITNANESPTDIDLSNATVSENAGANAVVGALSAIGDPDAGATHTFALVGGTGSTDNAAFILSGNSLRLSASADFETKPSYSVRVEANDGLGGTFAKAFTITVTNVNEPPTDISLSNTIVPENGGINLVVGSLAALGDPDAGATHSFSLVAGTGSTDNASFNLDGSSLRLNASADFELKSSYSVRVEANDGSGGIFARAFTILISNVNEPPTDISLSNASVPENAGINALVGNLAALGDPDGGATHSYTLVAGTGSTDNADFNISGASLRLSASANFELKANYSVRVRADDGSSGTFEKAFAITITDVNEAPSVTGVTASGDEDTTGITVTFSGSDPDSNPLTYSIVTGPLSTEGTLGAVAGNTVVFTPAANYNGVVNFTYKATDGSLESNTGTATVTVNAVNDPPTITDISSLSILEDGTTGPLAFAINDVDAGAVLSVSAFTNNQTLAPDGELVLGGSGGSRTIAVTPEADQNGSVTVTVQVSDGLLTAQDTFNLTVTAVNDEPSFDLSRPIMPFGPVRNAEGRLWAWGLNNDGQIGDGSIGTAGQPVQVGSQTDWQKVATGDSYTFAVKSNGTLWAWGDNFYGQLGDGSTTDRDEPGQVGEDNDWSSVSGGDGHVVAVKEDGSLWAWGRNDYGQVGNGSTAAAATPQRIGLDSDWRAASAGSLHTVAVKTDGSLWAWGRNQFGQLGTGSTTSASAPVRIGMANDWMGIAAGGLHTLALKSNGTLWAWGRNSDGQLGDGTVNQSNTPKQIGIDTDWEQIVPGYTFSLALKGDGSLWAWGRNADGQVADGSRTNRLAPQRIGLDNDWASIAAGRNHGLALRFDGTLWTWGDNDTFQMGSGSIGDFLTVTQLGTETWSAIAGGLGHTVAIEPESLRLTIPANSGPFLLPGFATDILAGPLDEQAIQNVSFEVSNDDNDLFVTQPAIDENGDLTLVPGVDAGTLTVTVRAKDDGGVANGGDDTSPPQTFSITITVAPEIMLTGNSQEIDNGDDTPDTDDHTDFVETPTVGGSVVRTFTVTNPGTAPLTLGNITINGSSAFSLTTPPASNTVARLGGTQTFSITFDPTTAVLHTATVSIESDDEDENPFTFDIQGLGITPEIYLSGDSVEIPNGDATPGYTDLTHFGNAEVVGGTVSRTFQIENRGTQDLTLSGEPRVTLTGSSSFTVSAQPTTSPVPKNGGSTPFTILFDPASRGEHTAIVSIANNDEDEAPSTFTIRGIGLAPEISITGNGAEILSGDSVPSANDHTLFGSIGAAMTRTFTIRNEGNLVLNLGSPAVTISGSNLFTLTTPPAVSTLSAEAGTTTFAITFDPDDPGIHSAIVSVASDDTDESPYTFTIRGNGLTELTTSFRAVIGQGRMNLAALINPLPAGGVFSGPGVINGFFNPDGLAPGDYTLVYTVQDAVGQDLATEFEVTVELSPARLRVGKPRSFATTTVGTSSRPQVIEIENLGGEDADSVRVLLSGKGRKDFRITQPGSSVRGGGKDSFQVTFAPRKEGVRKAKATIMSSAGPVTINLSGRGKARSTNSSGHLPGG